MNLGRFQLAINHDSPEVVLKGLNEFRMQVLSDHDAVELFGYNGRSCSIDRSIAEVLLPNAQHSLTGLLLEYITKSPQLEELFVLWSLPGREDDRALCSGHMACFAVVLHFAKSNANVCNGIVSRILCDHLKSLHAQLASGNTELIHATLGLILAMVRTSHQNCKDVFQKLNLSSQTLDSVIQKGKTVNWKCSVHSHQLVTDSRLLVIMIVCLVLESVDENAVLELFAEKSLMRKIMHSIGRDSPDTLQIVLPGVLHALKRNPVLSPHVHDIFDGATVRQLVLLYARPEESMQIFGHAFVLQLVDQMKTLQFSGKRSKGGGSQYHNQHQNHQAVSASVSVGRTCAYLAQHLEPHSDLRQQEVLMAVLALQPYLLSKSIASLSVLKSWEPIPSTEYLSVVRYLSQLLHAAAIDHKSKAQLRAMFGNGITSGTSTNSSSDTIEEVVDETSPSSGATTEDMQQRSQAQQSLLNSLVNSWMPPGLTKKDICKMISHKELSLQRVGLQLVTALAQRLQRAVKESGVLHGTRARGGGGGGGSAAGSTALSGGSVGVVGAAGSTAVLEHCLAATMQTYLPDFQLLINMRSRLVKLLGDSSSSSTSAFTTARSAEEEKGSKEDDAMVVTDDFDFNIEGAEESGTTEALKQEVAKLAVAQDTAAVCPGSVYETLYVLFLELVETYLDLSPHTISAVKFDLLRLLDEYVPWDTAQSAHSALSIAQALNPDILLAILRVLRQATNTIDCRWFGQQDDAVKMLINLIVAEDWKSTMKRTALMKLMLLAATTGTFKTAADTAANAFDAVTDVSRRARSLCKTVLIQSGLFVGHTVLDFELNTELNAWLAALRVVSNDNVDDNNDSDDSVLVVETLLRLSHHWNTPLSIAAANSASNFTTSYLTAVGIPLASKECSSLVPYSPVLYCSMNLLSANFELFSTLLPKHIRARISCDLTADAFFDKFKAQFCVSVQRMFAHIAVAVVKEARSSEYWCRVVYSGLEQAQLCATPCVAVADFLNRLAMITVFDNTMQFDSIPAPLIEFLGSRTSNGACCAEPASKKSKKVTKTISTSVVYDFQDNVLHFPEQCMTLLTHWSDIESIILNPSESDAKLAVFAEENWLFLHSVLLLSPSSVKSLSAAHFEWATQQWKQDVERAHGLHSKLCLLRSALALALRVASVVPGKYTWRQGEGLGLSSRKAASAVSTAVRSTRKRSKSDMESEDRAELFAALSLPFLHCVLESTTALLTAASGSPITMQLLFTEHVIKFIASSTWIGDWLRSLYNTAACAALRHLGPHGIGRFSAPVLLLWMNLALALAKTKLSLADGTECSSLHALAEAVIKIVDCHDLRKLVVGQSVDTARLTGLAGLKELASTAADAPALAQLDGVTEEVMDVAPLNQLIEASMNDAVLSDSPLLCTIFKTSDSMLGEPSHFMDIKCLHERDSIVAALPGVLTSVQIGVKVRAHLTALLEHELPHISSTDANAGGKVLAKAAKSNFSNVELVDLMRTSGNEVVEASISARALDSDAAILSEVFETMSDLRLNALFNASLVFILKSHGPLVCPIIFSALNYAFNEKGDDDVSTWSKYCAHLSTALLAAIDSCLTALNALTAAAAEADTTIAMKNTLYANLAAKLSPIHALCGIPRLASVSPQTILRALGETTTALLKKRLNKLVRNALKCGIECPAVLHWMRALLEVLQLDKMGESPLLFGEALQPVDGDFYSPDTLFSLLPGHSKFSLILGGAKDHQHTAKLPLLILLLHLTQYKTQDRRRTKSGSKNAKKPIVLKSAESDAERYLLADSVLTAYSGTLSAPDRVCLRILTLLVGADMCPALYMLQPRAVAGVVTAEGPRTAHELLANSARWMVESVTPQFAYATLSKFPLWRGLHPQPLGSLESQSPAEDKTAESQSPFHSSSIEREWKSSAEAMEVDDDAHSLAEEGDATDSIPEIDLLLQCSDKILDPAFYMPAFLHVLRNQEVSVRQMANCGALSLMISCLGSPCVGLRTCALACLQFVRNMLEQQTPTRDAAFRERAQLALLLSYVRNSFELGEKATGAPRLPLTTAIFLGRAAMNLMQPNHELFSRVNKYLLCRPFCDVKDVPLYDLLLVNGDAQSDQVQRLAALRLFRDGLLTKQDHLNLCRKNAYNRLMLLFPLLAKDTRAGHAILDLFDRGLGFKYSARYLLERCSLTAWIKLLAAPMGAMHLPATVTEDSTNCNSHVNSVRHDNEVTQSAYYSKYLVRAVTILRRIIASAYLLSIEDSACAVHLQVARTALTSAAWDAIHAVQCGYTQSLPMEYFTQLVLSMWDISIAIERNHASKEAAMWQEDLLLSLYETIQTKFSGMAQQSRQVSSNLVELQLSVLALVKFSSTVGSKASSLHDHLRRVSFVHLISHSSNAASKTAGGSLAILRASQPETPTVAAITNPELTPHALLDRVTLLPYYTSVCDYYVAVMEADSVGGGQFERSELAWTVTASTDLSQMLALPTSLGRHFMLNCVASIISKGDVAITSAIDALRWLCIVNAAYPNAVNGVAECSASSDDALIAARVAASLVGNGVKKDGSINTDLFVFACKVLCSANLAAPKAHKQLTTELNTLVQVINLVDNTARCTFNKLSSTLFNYIARLVTVHDHPAGSLDGVVDAILMKSLQQAAEQTLSLVTTILQSLPAEVNKSVLNKENANKALEDFVREAMSSEYFPAMRTTSTSAQALGGAAIYLSSSHIQRIPRTMSASATALGMPRGDMGDVGDIDDTAGSTVGEGVTGDEDMGGASESDIGSHDSRESESDSSDDNSGDAESDSDVSDDSEAEE